MLGVFILKSIQVREFILNLIKGLKFKSPWLPLPLISGRGRQHRITWSVAGGPVGSIRTSVCVWIVYSTGSVPFQSTCGADSKRPAFWIDSLGSIFTSNSHTEAQLRFWTVPQQQNQIPINSWFAKTFIYKRERKAQGDPWEGRWFMLKCFSLNKCYRSLNLLVFTNSLWD